MKRRMVWGSLAVLMCGLTAMPAVSQRQVSSSTRAENAEARAGEALSRLVTVDLDRAPVSHAIDVVARSAGVRIQYRADILDTMPGVITLRATQRPLGAVLEQIFVGTALYAQSIAADLVTVKVMPPSVQQDGIVTGTVVHATTKQPIARATVSVEGTSRSVTTDEHGIFQLSLPDGSHTLNVRMLGFARKTHRVDVRTDQTTRVEIILQPSANVMDEVIVTGTVVTTERKALATPITVITAEEIEKRGITRLEQFFRGEVPGVISLDIGVQAYTEGEPGMGVVSPVFGRGASSLQEGAYGTRSNPLKTYVDGVEIVDPAYLGTINTNTIERMEIITGPQAATIYGSNAMGGVIAIFTKKGLGHETPEVTLNAKYGILENNFSSGLTPAHEYTMGVGGGSGTAFSYMGSLSYNYRGQWQPKLFNRAYGGSFGITHSRNALAIRASVSANRTGTGTMVDAINHGNVASGGWCAAGRCFMSPYHGQTTGEDIETGRISKTAPSGQRISRSSSQTASLNLDYRVTPWWQHGVTLGTSYTNLDVDPLLPQFAVPADSMWLAAKSSGTRITASYNTNIRTEHRYATSSLTLGANGSRGEKQEIRGCLLSSDAGTFEDCPFPGPAFATTVFNDQSWGGFAQWQLGLMDQLFLTLGVRGESNPNYGKNHRIDWTPTNGVSYVMEYGDLTVKLLGSYGKSTRPPTPDQRRSMMTVMTFYAPSTHETQLEAPLLRPERSTGPQGGIEMYYGSLGSLAITRYVQTVDDLIQSILVDSAPRAAASNPASTSWWYTTQNMNVGKIKNHGWEATGSINVWRLMLKGTYSWADSRILAIHPEAMIGNNRWYGLRPGDSFSFNPSHTGNFVASYSWRGTNVTMTSNWRGVGRDPTSQELSLLQRLYSRLSMYAPYRGFGGGAVPIPGYAKTDLAMSQRLNPWASATINITNLGDSHASDVGALFPTLGRQTLVGVSLRFPRR